MVQGGEVIPFCVITSKMMESAITVGGTVEIAGLYELSGNKEVLSNESQVLDISKYDNLIEFFHSRRNVRFFNEISRRKYHYEKKSTERNKIRLEYLFHEFIPSELKHYFVTPRGL